MRDTLGTLFGFILGASLLFMGITIPDKYSNYYVYQISHYEELISNLEKTRRPIIEIRRAKSEAAAFKSSIIGSISRFADLKSFGIVAGGAFAALLIAFPFSKAMHIFVFIFQALGRDTMKEEFLDVYETVIYLAEKRSGGEIITDDDIENIENDNLREWVQDFIVVDVVSEEMIREIIQSEIEMYNYRAFEEIDVLKFMGTAAPAFGMVGTVVGLILMLGQAAGAGSKISDIMGAMSVALITTLYGVLAAQLIFIPVASKRYQLKESNTKLLEMIQESIIYLKRKELAETISQDLIIYLPKKFRQEILDEKMEAMQSGALGL
jgi:chemotaxis protein MotA